MDDRAMILAADLMLGGGITAGVRDHARTVLAIRAGIPMRIILDKRAVHRTWITVAQREWQGCARRGTFPKLGKGRPGRHHDSRAIRERYVRCKA